MIDPPHPGIPALLLTVASKLGYLVTTRDDTGRELGDDGSTQRPLVMAGGGGVGRVVWAIVDVLPTGFGPFLLTRLTAEVLRGGSPEDDGSVSFQGVRYTVRSWYDGVNMIADAVRM